MGDASTSDACMLPALDKTEEDGGGVDWKSVNKLVRFINSSHSITTDVRYSLKARMKSQDSRRVLNTLTVYHTIGLNAVDAVRQQLSEPKWLHTFEKIFRKNKDENVRHGILQLLMDWSFLFVNLDLGKGSTEILREISTRKGLTTRPSSLATRYFKEYPSLRPASFVRGFEFDGRKEEIVTHKEKCTKKVSMSCTANLTPGSLKFGSVRKLFSRQSTKSIGREGEVSKLGSIDSTIEESTDRSWVDTMLRDVPRDCKNLQDLLSDVQVLLNRGNLEDVQSKMAVAEHLRNKCATSNNMLQEMITTKMKKVTLDNGSEEREEIQPASLSRLLQAGEALTSALQRFEQTHREFVWHLDQEASLNHGTRHRLSTSESEDVDLGEGSSRWVEFPSPRTPLASQMLAAGEDRGTEEHLRTPLRPTSSLGYRLPLESRMSNSSAYSAERMPLPMPAQSPFANAGALLEAARDKTKSQSQSTEISSDETPRRFDVQGSFTRRPSSVELSSRSFSEAVHRSTGTTRRNVCPALKVRFTDEHLDEVISRMASIK